MAFDKKRPKDGVYSNAEQMAKMHLDGDYRLRRIPVSQLTDGSEFGCLSFETKRKSIPLAIIRLTGDAGECSTQPLKCALTPFTQWHFESR